MHCVDLQLVIITIKTKISMVEERDIERKQETYSNMQSCNSMCWSIEYFQIERMEKSQEWDNKYS